MAATDVIEDVRDGVAVAVADGVARIVLARPDQLNAYDEPMARELARQARRVAADEAVRVVVLEGRGRAFSAGGDLKAVLALSTDPARDFYAEWLTLVMAAGDALREIPVPTVAAVRGLALAGGLELALCCDLIVASDRASFGDQHVNQGLLPGGGASVRLPARVGQQRARELIFSGRRIGAEEAVDIGLALWQRPEDEFDAALAELVGSIAAKDRDVLVAAKALMQAQAPESRIAIELEARVLAARIRTPALQAKLEEFKDRGRAKDRSGGERT